MHRKKENKIPPTKNTHTRIQPKKLLLSECDHSDEWRESNNLNKIKKWRWWYNREPNRTTLELQKNSYLSSRDKLKHTDKPKVLQHSTVIPMDVKIAVLVQNHCKRSRNIPAFGRKNLNNSIAKSVESIF